MNHRKCYMPKREDNTGEWPASEICLNGGWHSMGMGVISFGNGGNAPLHEWVWHRRTIMSFENPTEWPALLA